MTDGDKDRVTSRMSKRLNLFTTSQMSSIGFYDLDKHRVDTETERPQSRTYYRESPLVQREIDRQVMELLRHGFIEPSTSMWRSPVVLVKKRDGNLSLYLRFPQAQRRDDQAKFPCAATRRCLGPDWWTEVKILHNIGPPIRILADCYGRRNEAQNHVRDTQRSILLESPTLWAV